MPLLNVCSRNTVKWPYTACVWYNMNTFLQEETHLILFQHPEMCQPGYTHQPSVPHNSGTPWTMMMMCICYSSTASVHHVRLKQHWMCHTVRQQKGTLIDSSVMFTSCLTNLRWHWKGESHMSITVVNQMTNVLSNFLPDVFVKVPRQVCHLHWDAAATQTQQELLGILQTVL